MRTYRLGDEAVAYIKQCLLDGDTLAKYLLDLKLEEGEITTCLPSDTSPEAVRQFDTGGVTSRQHTKERLVTQIKGCLGAGDERIAVFETLARPGDPSLSLHNTPFFVDDDRVYYIATLQSDESQILDAVQFARMYPFVGVLTSLPQGKRKLQSGQNIGRDTLKSLASACQYMLIGAYDAEGVLLWERKSSSE